MAQDNQWTIGKCLVWTTEYFTRNRLENPRLEAEVLLGRAIGRTRVQLYMNLEQPLQLVELARYREMIKQRVQGTPTAYLIGEKEFMSLTFEVNRQVLIPRPDTEVLVEIALEALGYSKPGQPVRDARESSCAGVEESSLDLVSESQSESQLAGSAEQPGGQGSQNEHPLIVDVGTGSGNIAIVLARYLPGARVIGIDISDRALEVAQRNARKHAVEDQVTFYEGDLLSPLENQQLKRQVDLITANLPYIPSNELPHLMREVLQEPITALDGGRDGLMYYRRMIPQALEYLKPGGALILEIGLDQGKAVRKLLADGWESVQIRLDYGGRDRVVYARSSRPTAVRDLRRLKVERYRASSK